MTRFLNGSESAVPFSDRKLETDGDRVPWTLEELVEAQCMGCAGASSAEIAERLGRGVGDVERKLNVDRVPRPPRETTAGVGFPNLKRR